MKQWIVLLLTSVLALSAFAQDSGNTQPLTSQDGSVPFSKANPEDITNENFPNLIESFDYPNADISEIVKAISKLTGKNFILEKGVSGTISIIAPSQITVAEAYKAFLTALAMNGYTVVPSGNFLKIRSLQNATTDSIETYAGNYFPNSDQLVTRIVKLKYINAEEVQKTLRPLVNKQGDITPYAPTNSLIITDFGSNVERMSNIINQLDVPGFEEKLVVIPIKFARAKDMADLIDQIINKGDKKNSRFSSGIPRFRSRNNNNKSTGGTSGAANYSLVIPDTRTNSIIVVGNQAGIARIRGLVAKLDFRLRPEDAGGVYVYYVRHGEAEKVANVLNGIATESTKSNQEANKASTGGSNSSAANPVTAPQAQAVFGGDVKVAADKENNSLIITAGKQDYEVVRAILAKIDIPRDQVFVKAVIMEMSASDSVNWGVNVYRVQEGTNGVGRAGFTAFGLGNVVNPSADRGMILGFGNDNLVEVTIGDTTTNVPDLFGLINFLKTQSSVNILSTPQISALDNEEAEIIVSTDVPISASSNTNEGVTSSGFERKDLQLKLALTPFISPDTDSVRLKIDQKVESLANQSVVGDAFGGQALAFQTRSVKTNIIVNSEDTAVLGGLMQDEDQDTIAKVPVLGDIPILGWLFKGKEKQKIKRNLLIFITPQIIRNSQDASDLLDQKLNERIDFVQQNMRGRDPHGYELDKLPRKQVSELETEEFLEGNQTGSSASPIRLEEEEQQQEDFEELDEEPLLDIPEEVE